MERGRRRTVMKEGWTGGLTAFYRIDGATKGAENIGVATGTNLNRRAAEARRQLFLARFKRILFAFPVATLLTAAGTMVAMWVGIQKIGPQQYDGWLLCLAGFGGLLVVTLQSWANHRRVKYDVTIALKYEQKFFKEYKTERLVGARAVLAVLNAAPGEERARASKNVEIEPVLDIWEDLGFLVHGDQISDEVAHHYFYHWMRMYVQPLQEHLAELGEKGAAEYKYTLMLFDRLRIVEAEEQGWGLFRRIRLTVHA
jgi:hypothetical protein